MAIIKRAGQTGVTKVSGETLQDRLNRLSAGSTTDAATAASVGATPQQAAMAGADNRKQAVLKQSVDMGTNLQATQAQPGAPQAISASQTAELQAAQKLASLGGVSGKIGEQAAARLSGAPIAPVVRQVNATKVGATVSSLFPQETPEGLTAKSKSVTDALVTYANAGSNAQTRNDALIELQRLGIPGDQAEGLLETTDQALQRTITTQPAIDLDAALKASGLAGGTADLAQTLGIPSDQLATMTMDDIDTLIENRRKEIAGKYATMQTKAAGVGLGAAAAKQNLTSAANVMGQLKTATGAPAIDFTAKVKIGDSEYDAETILKDEEFSNVIEQWLNATTPEDRAKIIPANWPLSQWLTDNEKTLQAATAPGMATIQDTTFAAGTAGNTLTNLPKEVAAIYGFTPKDHYTSSDIAAMDAIAAKWADSPLAKAGADKDYLTMLSKNPAALTAANAATPEDIKASMKAFKDLSKPVSVDDPTTLSTKVAELPEVKADPMMLLPSTRDAVQKRVDLYTADPQADAWLKGPNSKYYIGIDSDSLINLAKQPQLREEYETYKADVESFSNLDKMSDKDQSNLAFGVVGAESLNTAYKQLQEDAALGDADAMAQLTKIRAMDTDADGDIDINDAKALNAKQKTDLLAFDAKSKIINAQPGPSHYQSVKDTTDKLATSLLPADASRDLVMGILRDPSTANTGNVQLLDEYQKKIDAERATTQVSPERAAQLFKLENQIYAASSKAYADAITNASKAASDPASSMEEYKARRDSLIEQAKSLGNKPSSKALLDAINTAVSQMNVKINAVQPTTSIDPYAGILTTGTTSVPDFSGIGNIGIGANIDVGSGGGKGDIGGGSSLSTPMMGPAISGVQGSAKSDGGGWGDGGSFGGFGSL